jgi:ComF family protein
MAQPPRFDIARSAGVYDGTLRQAIHMFKYRGGLQFAQHFGRLLAERGRRFFEVCELDLVAAVPLHRSRLRQRGYNQALELARFVSSAWDVPLSIEGLARTKQTPQQAALTRQERAANIRGAFAWTGPRLAGRRVLLVDDVYTSGATANECARVLKQAGAGTVSVLTLAHTQ